MNRLLLALSVVASVDADRTAFRQACDDLERSNLRSPQLRQLLCDNAESVEVCLAAVQEHCNCELLARGSDCWEKRASECSSALPKGVLKQHIGDLYSSYCGVSLDSFDDDWTPGPGMAEMEQDLVDIDRWFQDEVFAEARGEPIGLEELKANVAAFGAWINGDQEYGDEEDFALQGQEDRESNKAII